MSGCLMWIAEQHAATSRRGWRRVGASGGRCIRRS
ncbi:hypothetical protein [Wenjunlia vitaminophila]